MFKNVSLRIVIWKNVEIHMKIYMIIDLSMISIVAEHLHVYHLGVAESLALLGEIEVMS